MLAIFDQLAATRDWDFVALAPQHGRLADALRRRSLRHVPFDVRAPDGQRHPREQLCAVLLEALGTIDHDLLHANSLSMGRLTGAVASELRQPCTAHLRDIMNLSGAAIAELNCNRRLFAVSQATRDHHAEQGLQPDRIRVIYNGVDCRSFSPRRKSALRQEWRIPESAFVALTIGQIGLRKGQDVLAEAAVVASDTARNIHYVVVGERNSSKAESIAFEQNVMARFDDAGLAQSLHRLGYRTDMPDIYGSVDLLVHPAQQEPLGRVLLEAAAMGLPIVATEVGGTAEILRNGVSARLVPANDPYALAQAIIEMQVDQSLRERCAAAARECVMERFSIERAAQSLSAAWQDVLAAG